MKEKHVDSFGRNSTSDKKDWGTPPKYVNLITQMFPIIELDPCSNDYSIVPALVNYKLPQNGLEESWNFKTIYVNPPYGRDMGNGTHVSHWLDRCTEAHLEYGSEVLALIPVATNTKHWKNNIFLKSTGVCFLEDTRLKFLNNGVLSKKGAPMACAMIYWGKDYNKFYDIFSAVGKCFLTN